MAKKPESAHAIKGDDFQSVSRRLECDDDKAVFEARLGKIARVKAKPAPTKPKRK